MCLCLWCVCVYSVSPLRHYSKCSFLLLRAFKEDPLLNQTTGIGHALNLLHVVSPKSDLLHGIGALKVNTIRWH